MAHLGPLPLAPIGRLGPPVRCCSLLSRSRVVRHPGLALIVLRWTRPFASDGQLEVRCSGIHLLPWLSPSRRLNSHLGKHSITLGLRCIAAGRHRWMIHQRGLLSH